MIQRLIIDSSAEAEELDDIQYVLRRCPETDICIIGTDGEKSVQRISDLIRQAGRTVTVLKGPGQPFAGTDRSDEEAVTCIPDMVNGIADFLSAGEKTDILLSSGASDLAFALHACPELKEKISRLMFIGGCYCFGDVTPVAEKNAYRDPEGLQMILHGGIETYLIPLELKEKTGLSGMRLGICALIHPEYFAFVRYKTETETFAEYTRGMTVIYRNGLDYCEFKKSEAAETVVHYVEEKDKNAYYPEVSDLSKIMAESREGGQHAQDTGHI